MTPVDMIAAVFDMSWWSKRQLIIYCHDLRFFTAEKRQRLADRFIDQLAYILNVNMSTASRVYRYLARAIPEK